MTLPNWVNFEFSERTAATMARGLSGPSSTWEAMLAHAQAVLAARSDDPQSDSQISYEFDKWQDLVAAARILDLASTTLGLDEAEDRRTAAILAACAFGMSGTAVSAAAAIDAHNLMSTDLSSGELASLAISSPTLSREIYPNLPTGTPYRACIEHLAAYLANGSDGSHNMARAALADAIREEKDVWESYLMRLSRVSLEHASRLATYKVLGQHESTFPEGYLARLVADSPMLLPSQYEAIRNHGVLDPECNLLISLPTGTGKTLLGELALMSAAGREPGLVCYITPYVALGRQVAEKINHHTPPGIRARRMVGGYQEPIPLDPENRLEIVVITPERFDAMIRLSPELLSTIKCVVFDEAHMIGNRERGIRIEGLLTRIQLATARGQQIPRFVLLSAVLSNSDAIADWLDISPENVIRGTWRPSARRLLRWTENGMLRMHAGDDPLRSTSREILGECRLPWPQKRFYKPRHFGDIKKQEPLALENVAYLAEYEHEQFRQPVLCVCSTRPKTRHLADQIAQRFPQLEPSPQSIRSVTDLIDQKYPYLLPLKVALERGVAYHNSSLPHDVREGIERAVDERDLKVVTATTTLAEGVDLPFRATILADWLIFDGDKNRPMESLLFRNIAGRCGRAGKFTEGDTIIFDNPVGEAEYTTPERRPQWQGEIFFTDSPPALASAIGTSPKEVAVAVVGSQLLAAIPENPEIDDLASSFSEFSFSKRARNSSIAEERITLALEDILDQTQGEPLAVASSPARLTTFGKAANVAGLSPATARSLRNALGEIARQGSSQQNLVNVCASLLKALGNVVEQQNSDLRKAVTNRRSRPVVRLDELESVLSLWVTGESTESIFASLPRLQRSTRKPRLQAWIQGVSEDSSWVDEFAKFQDFVDNCLGFFLPWVLRSAAHLSDSDQMLEVPWNKWASFIEHGVDSNWAVTLLKEEVFLDRPLARNVGNLLESLEHEPDVSQQQVFRSIIEIVANDHETAERAFSLYEIARDAEESLIRRRLSH